MIGLAACAAVAAVLATAPSSVQVPHVVERGAPLTQLSRPDEFLRDDTGRNGPPVAVLSLGGPLLVLLTGGYLRLRAVPVRAWRSPDLPAPRSPPRSPSWPVTTLPHDGL
jgi:hypothetical protein